MSEKADKAGTVECQCGKVYGIACFGTGSPNEMVVVEWMPFYLRASHEAAMNRGVYPHNGAERLVVHEDCADFLVEEDGDWTEIIEEANPEEYLR